MRTTSGLGFVAICATVFLSACASPPPPSHPNPLLSQIMPGFEGKTLNLTPFDTGQADGHPMIVKFFSTSCARCKSSLSAIQRIYEDNPDIVIVGVSEDESITQARKLVEGLGVRFPVIYDETGRLARKYSVARMPVTFVVAKNGNVSWVGGPDQTEDGVRAAVSAVDN